MKKNETLWLLVFMMSAFLVACGGGDDDDADDRHDHELSLHDDLDSDDDEESNDDMPINIPDAMTENNLSGNAKLTDKDIDNYILVLKDLRNASNDMGNNVSSAFATNNKMYVILEKHNLSMNQFMAIQAAVGKASVADAMGSIEKAPKMDAVFESQLAQMAKMPGMTPEKIADARARMQEAQANAKSAEAQSKASMASIPDGNIELVKRRIPDIRAVLK